jgi:hypothetical protein
MIPHLICGAVYPSGAHFRGDCVVDSICAFFSRERSCDALDFLMEELVGLGLCVSALEELVAVVLALTLGAVLLVNFGRGSGWYDR